MKGNHLPLPSTVSKILNIMIITVCVDSDTTDQIVRAAKKMTWLVGSSSFDAYISTTRRPSLGFEMRSAEQCIAIVDFDKNSAQASETAQYLIQILAGKLTVIALAKNSDSSTLLTAMRSGCNEFLYKPLQESAVEEVFDRLGQRWTNSASSIEPAGGSILSLLGVKGGGGTTTLAIHLAMYLVQCHQKRTLLIDNHSELGHVCIYLGLDGSRFHFHELIRNVSRLDSELLQGFVAKHASGLEILSSPDVCDGAKSMDPDAVAKTLEFLRSEYDYVIIDCAKLFDETNLAILRSSAYIYLIATQEFAAIRDLSRYVDKLIQIDNSMEKLRVVINRFIPSYAIDIGNIEKAIKIPVSLCISDNYQELMRSANIGETIPPKSKMEFSVQLVKWVESIVGTPQPITSVKKDKKYLPIWKKALLQSDS